MHHERSSPAPARTRSPPTLSIAASTAVVMRDRIAPSNGLRAHNLPASPVQQDRTLYSSEASRPKATCQSRSGADGSRRGGWSIFSVIVLLHRRSRLDTGERRRGIARTASLQAASPAMTRGGEGKSSGRHTHRTAGPRLLWTTEPPPPCSRLYRPQAHRHRHHRPLLRLLPVRA